MTSSTMTPWSLPMSWPSEIPFPTVFVLPSPNGIVITSEGQTSTTVSAGQTGLFQAIPYVVATDQKNLTISFSQGLQIFAIGTAPPSTIPPTSNSPQTTNTSTSSSAIAHIPPLTNQEMTSTNSRLLQTRVANSTSAPASASASIPGLESNGLKGGAVAGVAIGCLIAGALITGLLVWALLGRRRKSGGGGHPESSAVALIHREKGPTSQVASAASASPISQAWENRLPQPLEDNTISGEVSKISNAIKNHVQSFYHNSRVSPGLLDLDDLQGLGKDLPMSTGTLSTLLGNVETREIALRFCIAWVAVSRMQFHAPPTTTFLPPEIALCFLSMVSEDRGSQSHALHLSKWRVITADLIKSAYVRSPFSTIDPRSQNINAAINVLEGILQPYTDSRVDNAQRRRNLEEILKRSAIFAFTMFSQPNSWRFDWQNEEVFKSGSLCVFPALVQIADENGEAVKPPRAFSEAIIRHLSE